MSWGQIEDNSWAVISLIKLITPPQPAAAASKQTGHHIYFLVNSCLTGSDDGYSKMMHGFPPYAPHTG